MSAVKWHAGPMLGYDTETTGTNPHEDRVVTAAVVQVQPGQRPRTMQWLLHPGVDILAEAAEVHGWTNDRITATLGTAEAARNTGGDWQPIPRDVALFEIAGFLASAMGREIPVVIANAPFDITLTEAELQRHGVDTIASRPAGIRGVVDPMVIDKAFDPYRKSCYKAPGCDPETRHHECGGCRGGKVPCGGCGSTDRTLMSLCAHYGVRHVGAHDAAGDALAAVRLAPRIAGHWPEIARWKLPTLHAHQVTWKREQAASLEKFFRKIGKPEPVSGDWPIQAPAETLTGVGW